MIKIAVIILCIITISMIACILCTSVIAGKRADESIERYFKEQKIMKFTMILYLYLKYTDL